MSSTNNIFSNPHLPHSNPRSIQEKCIKLGLSQPMTLRASDEGTAFIENAVEFTSAEASPTSKAIVLNKNGNQRKTRSSDKYTHLTNTGNYIADSKKKHIESIAAALKQKNDFNQAKKLNNLTFNKLEIPGPVHRASKKRSIPYQWPRASQNLDDIKKKDSASSVSDLTFQKIWQKTLHQVATGKNMEYRYYPNMVRNKKPSQLDESVRLKNLQTNRKCRRMKKKNETNENKEFARMYHQNEQKQLLVAINYFYMKKCLQFVNLNQKNSVGDEHDVVASI